MTPSAKGDTRRRGRSAAAVSPPGVRNAAPLVVGLSAVIVAVTDGGSGAQPRSGASHRGSSDGMHSRRELPDGQPRVLMVGRSLPSGPLDPEGGQTLERSLHGWVQAQTGLELGYVEQLYTFGDRYREPRGGERVLSIAYLALVREVRPVGGPAAGWRDVYDALPWEDSREGVPALVAASIHPALKDWVAKGSDVGQRARRRERVDITFGQHGAAWDAERVLERYELLYEAGLVAEALRGESAVDQGPALGLGLALDWDHRRMLATALGRLRGKLRYRPVVFELLPPRFTLLQLQRVVEALSGVRLHKQNFRRLVEDGGLVFGTGSFEDHTGGRPAELFSFRREVLRERPAPGVGIPKQRG